jgi:hypothetical protein
MEYRKAVIGLGLDLSDSRGQESKQSGDKDKSIFHDRWFRRFVMN